VFTCVGWQVPLCDPIWQVTLRSHIMGYVPLTAIQYLYLYLLLLQESLANTKVSTRQPWYIGCNSLNRPPFRIAKQYQRNLYIIEKYFQCATIPLLTMRVYLHSFSRGCLPNMPTSAKFLQNLNVQQFKVIQGR